MEDIDAEADVPHLSVLFCEKHYNAPCFSFIEMESMSNDVPRKVRVMLLQEK
jgi:hypothetical protein